MSKRYTILTSLLALSSISGSALARTAEGPTLEEIIVTANFRETTLMETVGSVSVVPESTITERAAQHLQDILNAVPNVTWASGASRSRFVQIRGIGDLEQYYDPKYYPSVGMRLDDLELGDSINAGMLFDVAQVEVLRGPQGTRFGASGHAGMINIISNAPTDSFEGELSGGVGNYDSYDAGLVLSGPLHENLRGRLAVQQNNSDGYIENEHLDKSDTNNFDELTSRARLQWTPTETALYELGVLYFDSDNGHDAWSIENDRTTWSDQPGNDTQKTAGVNASGTWQLADTLTLEADISYIDMDLHQSYDADWVSGEFCQIFTCSGGHETAQEIFDRDRDRLVADIRLLGGESTLAAGSGNYVIGLYANDSSENLDYHYPSVWYGDYSSNSDYEAQRYAVYGEYEYAVSSQLTLVAGARLERFEDDYRDSNAFRSDNNDNLWNAKLSARYDLEDNTMVYATIARSAKPGGVNTTATANQPFMSPIFQAFTQGKLSFDDESLLNTEVGIKTVQFDQRLSLSAALFYTDRSNAQLENWMWDDAAGLWIGYLDSTSDANNYGLEVESTFAINNHIELFANIGLLHAEVDAIEAFDLDEFDFVTRENRDQAKSPKYQYNIGTRVSFSQEWSGHVEVEGRGDSYYGYYHNGKLESYDLLNASLHWQRNAISVTVWGRNLTDKDFAVHGLYFGNDPRDDFGAYQNEVYTQLGEPRTYGIELTYAF
ncbi:MAG: TonB-dependent receptor [Halioglobus sp.]|nr:TonB-dependent receptor [Halioglobus sp.]